MTGETDKATIDFLSRPESYGLPPVAPVEHVETHISHVFLADERAFKLKRPVRFTFLDFSDAEKRRAACETEVALNRRTAPEIYLGVVALRRAGGELRLGGEEGEIVDWLVEMRRFKADGLLAAMADEGRLPLALVERLAADVARFHRAAEVRRARPGALQAVGAERGEPHIGPVFAAANVAEVDEACRELIEKHHALMDARRDAGWVRHCHGDLHLGNVTEIDGRPVIFDCIEFNDRFARIDVLYDLAFLLMDLAFRARVDSRLAAHANRALNAWLDHLTEAEGGGGAGGAGAAAAELGTRAVIRAKVAAAQEDGAKARAYLDFANAALKPAPPRLVAVGGLSGTGKSTLAKALALAPSLGGAAGAVHLRTDIIRKRMFGVEPLERLPDAAYVPGTGAQVYEEMLRQARIALEAGQGVLLDAVFARPEERQAAARLAARLGVSFTGLWLDAAPDVLEARVAAREREGRDPSDAGVEVLRRQLAYDLGVMDWQKVDASGSAAETLDRAAIACGHDKTGGRA